MLSATSAAEPATSSEAPSSSPKPPFSSLPLRSHVSGAHFRDYHLLLDEQATQIYGTTDQIAERVRKLGGTTLHSIGEIARLQRVKDNEAEYVTPLDMDRSL